MVRDEEYGTRMVKKERVWREYKRKMKKDN